jgi:hypothetical protein
MWTIILAIKVVAVGEYRFSYPSANDIFELANKPLHDVKKERVSSLFSSFSQNNRVINRKATFLKGAQLWFRNSIFFDNVRLSLNFRLAALTQAAGG